MAITTNVVGHFQEFYAIFENTLKEMGKSALVPKLRAQEAHRGNDESIRDLFENAGFSVNKILRDRFQMRFASGEALLNHLLVVAGFLPGWRSILPPSEEVDIFQALQTKLDEKATWEGELKMTVPMLYVEAIK